ncbi:39S ribosomal protein L40 mitochondrial-like isoform X1 [Biomphalaria pfeifferi]|uniref:Large ribosomal subunit protein mL40 n=1 Tax=Biomphalaria pfeifferi TaxID=112525 RepID=A0AAD8B0T0_BIOPF|nr:39S ribosomal protein L40 mitochondrial-like isoform X1 [Biomphalaria pfeifferi]
MALNMVLSALKQTAKLNIITCKFHTQVTPLLFQTSQLLWAEPMKKKKRIDPSVIAAREAKKIRRIEKEIKRLTKFGRILKPIEEVEIDNRKYRLALERKRPLPTLTAEEKDYRDLLIKEWGAYKSYQWHWEAKIMDQLTEAQQEALDELKQESLELYHAALQNDYACVPIEFQGPKETPPKKDYPAPDGEYVDTTRKY